jgi:hypothetical protein
MVSNQSTDVHTIDCDKAEERKRKLREEIEGPALFDSRKS